MANNQKISESAVGTPQSIPNYINVLSTETSNITIAVILVLLFLGTLRTFIAYLGWTRGTRYEKIFYDQTHQELARIAVSNTFAELNITPAAKSSLQLICPQIIRDVRLLDESQNLSKLLVLLATNSHSCLSIYGQETPVNTSVIINTMEASLLEESCLLMAELLLAIYTRKLLRNGQIDFVIVPKSGNPILAKKLADMLNAICLVCKSDKDSSHVMPGEHSSNLHNSITLNIEGFTYLKSKADSSEVPLNGILVDCNCSGGKGLLKTALEFNRVANSTGANIKPVEHGMVLFRADTDLSPFDFDFKFRNAATPLTIARYVDLSEELKRRLHGLKGVINDANGEIHKSEVRTNIQEILGHARENGLLVFE